MLSIIIDVIGSGAKISKQLQLISKAWSYIQLLQIAKNSSYKSSTCKTTKPALNQLEQTLIYCTELRTVYPASVAKGHAAYQSKMDRDKDG